MYDIMGYYEWSIDDHSQFEEAMTDIEPIINEAIEALSGAQLKDDKFFADLLSALLKKVDTTPLHNTRS